MEEGYIVAAVQVSRAIQLYSIQLSQQEAFEQKLAQQGLSVLVWGEGETEESAMAEAVALTTLKVSPRSKEE